MNTNANHSTARTLYATLSTAALLVAVAVVSPTPASAAEPLPQQDAAGRIEQIIESTGRLAGIPLTGQVTDTSTPVKTADEAAIDIPTTSSLPLSIRLPDDGNLTVKLPNSETNGVAEQTDSGLVYYAANAAATDVIAPLSDGAQLLNILSDESAAENFTYDFGSGDVAEIQATSDGGALLTDVQGAALAIIEAPWAIDANDVSVSTHYEIDGLKLTQVVKHHSVDLAYPVVTDPRITYHPGVTVLHFNKSESISYAGGASLAALGAGFLVVLVGAFVGVNAIWAQNVVAKGNCIAIGYTPFGPVLKGTAWFIDEKC